MVKRRKKKALSKSIDLKKPNFNVDFTLSECQRAKKILGFKGTIDELFRTD